MSVPRATIEKILAKAILAPSGDNSQPWQFEVQGNTIRFINAPESDTSPFNYNQISNYLALGAALENACITARQNGYEPTIAFFPSQNPLIVAEVTLVQGTPKSEPLYGAIAQRASNRRRYTDTPLAPEVLEKFTQLSNTEDGTVSIVSAKDQVRAIATLMSMGEKVTLETENIHSFLFDHVTWNEKDDAERHGFYIKTFEFAPPQEAAFRLFSNWNILRLVQPLGITNAIARDMAGVYGSSAAFGAISVTSATPESYVRAGMLLERTWLIATSLGIAMQATASIPLLSLALRHGGGSELSNVHKGTVQDAADKLYAEYMIPPSLELVFAFRLGYADAPSARTTRSAPRIAWH